MINVCTLNECIKHTQRSKLAILRTALARASGVEAAINELRGDDACTPLVCPSNDIRRQNKVELSQDATDLFSTWCGQLMATKENGIHHIF